MIHLGEVEEVVDDRQEHATAPTYNLNTMNNLLMIVRDHENERTSRECRTSGRSSPRSKSSVYPIMVVSGVRSSNKYLI